MKFSQKAKEHIDSCRFCWMCHHVCPIGNATGQERNTARARALGLSLVAREAVEYSDDIIDNVYECCLCAGCMADCVTGWDPVMFTKEARKIAALENKLPQYIEKMLDNYEEKGNVYGLDKNAELTDKIKTLNKSKTLLFLGHDAIYKAPEKAIKAIELLEKMGVDFTVMEDEPASGYHMNFMVGAVAETQEIAVNTAKALDFDTVICYDPSDAEMFIREYREWGIDMKAKVVTFTSFIADNLDKLNIKKTDKPFTIQDPPSLARILEEEEPLRKIVNAIGENREMLLNGKHTMLAGNLIMNEYMEDVITAVAKKRWINATNMDAKTVITACVADYIKLLETKPEDVQILTVEEAILSCL